MQLKLKLIASSVHAILACTSTRVWYLITSSEPRREFLEVLVWPCLDDPSKKYSITIPYTFYIRFELSRVQLAALLGTSSLNQAL